MQALKVEYTVKASFVVRNQENISRVMEEIRGINPTNFQYSVLLKNDGKTFVHLVMFTEETKHLPGTLSSFRLFQQELLASQPESAPAFDELTLVSSSKII